MKLPMKWLQVYADVHADAQDFSRRMTMAGSKVEGYLQEETAVRHMLSGKILSKEKHSNSDHLWVCSVAVDKDPIQIVTGAQNIFVNDVVPVALPGAVVAGGKEIRSGEIRGEKSEGMMCSLGELGLTANDFPDAAEDGIFILPNGTPPGMPVGEIVGLDDTVFEFEITPNRPDCLGILGLAREAAIAYGVPFTPPCPVIEDAEGDVGSFLSVDNHTPDNCLRYTAAVVQNVRIEPSPEWMRQRLRRCGVRPINNIVDITNYVMLEYNQPMHAFDLRHVEENHIIIRQARDGETIVTLDAVERALTSDMMVIADSKKPIAVAGVMGGEHSSILEDTTTIIFESACFCGSNVRATARSLGMRTEASSRFEKGLDPYNTEPALQRALQLVQQLNAGDVISGLADSKGHMPAQAAIELCADRVNRYLGTTDISRDYMVEILLRLGCSVQGNLVTPPTYRADIESFVDLCEEVGRFYGYDRIPSSVMRGSASARPSERQRFDRMVASLCVSCGLYEINTSSFMGAKDLDLLGVSRNSSLWNAVRIRNPLGEDTAMMRTTALPAMMETLARNYNARIPSAVLFELTREFLATDGKLPIEQKKLIFGGYGQTDFYYFKGVAEVLLRRMGIRSAVYQRVTESTFFHPGRSAAVFAGDVQIGVIGEIMPQIAQNFGVRERVYLADLDMDRLFGLQGGISQFKALPKFPGIVRDIALVCEIGLPSAEIEAVIRDCCGDLLESLSVFDVYTGEHIAAGQKSIAYSLTLRADDKTLTDEDADAVVMRTLAVLQGMDVKLRT